jgi:hypothetical protein
MTKTPKTKPLTPAATALNVWVLGRIADGRREFPNAICATSAAHLRRCMKAGLVEVVQVADAGDVLGSRPVSSRAKGTRLRITEAGRQAIGDQHACDGQRIKLIERDYSPEVVS